ncbi:unnamed protein product, partial [Didymodactylos carnosus]
HPSFQMPMCMPFQPPHVPYGYQPYCYRNMNPNPYLSQPHQHYPSYPYSQQSNIRLPPFLQQQQQNSVQYQPQYEHSYLLPTQQPSVLYQTPPPPPPPLPPPLQGKSPPRNIDLII